MIATKEWPIPLRDWEVKAIQAGRKTMTRFPIKGMEDYTEVVKILDPSNDMREFWRFSLSYRGATQCVDVDCPYGVVGDQLWVQQDWRVEGRYTDSYSDEEIRVNPSHFTVWRQAGVAFNDDFLGKIRPASSMPRWASRLLLEIADVRVERLHDISEADAIAEGCKKIRDSCYVFGGTGYDKAGLCHSSPTTAFAVLWDEINGRDSWAANPWLWCITFRRIDA